MNKNKVRLESRLRLRAIIFQSEKDDETRSVFVFEIDRLICRLSLQFL
jgi:hypothetical protein